MASRTTGTILLFLPFLILFVGSFCAIAVAVEVNGISGGGGGDGGAVELVSTVAEQREFDYFALALQWPPTYCKRSSKCCATNACCRGSDSPMVFTIHGLWPDYNDGSWPSCCSGPAFADNEISTLQDALNLYWPSLSCSKSSTCHGTKGVFWAHEWEKHGTCAYSVTGDEYNYFVTTINLYFKYNVTEVLLEAGYIPSNTEKYPEGGIISAIQNAFHTTPQLICKSGALEEVRLCFNKDFTFRECVAESSCPDYVSFPKYESLDLNGAGTADSLFAGIESY